jgi:hypothetical protein
MIEQLLSSCSFCRSDVDLLLKEEAASIVGARTGLLEIFVVTILILVEIQVFQLN